VRGAAFGWYNLTIGLAALPASLLFGGLWQAYGAQTAFITGAGLAMVAAVGLMMVASDPRVPNSSRRSDSA
jgi:MFS family permease